MPVNVDWQRQAKSATFAEEKWSSPAPSCVLCVVWWMVNGIAWRKHISPIVTAQGPPVMRKRATTRSPSLFPHQMARAKRKKSRTTRYVMTAKKKTEEVLAERAVTERAVAVFIKHIHTLIVCARQMTTIGSVWRFFLRFFRGLERAKRLCILN